MRITYDRLVFGQLPRRSVQVIADPDRFRYCEVALLALDEGDVLHAVYAKPPHRGALARAPDAVPVSPGEHQPVGLDDALLFLVAADRVVAAADRAALLHRPAQGGELLVEGRRRGLDESALLLPDARFRKVERQFPERRSRGAAQRRVCELGDPLGGATQHGELVRFQSHLGEVVRTARRPGARTAGAANREIGEVEVFGSEEVGLDLLVLVGRDDFVHCERHAQLAQLALVALELAAGGFAPRRGTGVPVLFVIRDLAQDLLARHRKAVVEEEGDEVEPALGLGHALDARTDGGSDGRTPG